MSLNDYNKEELHRLVKHQKSRILTLIDNLGEARDLAHQLLFELKEHVAVPATNIRCYPWLLPKDPGTSTEEVRHDRTE